jgi:uncharacterized protein YkwD
VFFGVVTQSVAYSPLPARLPERPEHYLEARLIEVTNAERVRAGLPVLRQSRSLADAARHHVEEMIRLGYFGHVSPTIGRRTVGERVAALGAAVVAVGENLAAVRAGGLDLPERIMTGWMQSPGHRDNLLNPRWTHVGFGLEEGPDGRLVVAQVFAADPNPLVFANASLSGHWTLRVRIEIESDAAGWVRVGHVGTPGAPVAVVPGSSVMFVVEQVDASAPTHLRLAWAQDRDSGFIGQESGWYEPATGRWTQDWRSESAVARVVRYASSQATREVVVQMAFERPADDLAIVFDGARVFGEVIGTNVRLVLPGNDGTRTLQIAAPVAEGQFVTVHAMLINVVNGQVTLRPGQER